ncbi:MAG: leucine-rich repeat domain-containing protein [Clostridia bacterium]|nr:leucine-rich repeat domain-containing protein [Clostridia bacterium]
MFDYIIFLTNNIYSSYTGILVFIYVVIVVFISIGVYYGIKSSKSNDGQYIKGTVKVDLHNTVIIKYSYKIAALSELNEKINFSPVDYCKISSNTIGSRNNLFNDFNHYENVEFLEKQKKNKLRNKYLYNHYYKKYVKEIEEKCFTPVKEIRKSGLTYSTFISLEKKIFESFLYKYDNSIIRVSINNTYYTPVKRIPRTASWEITEDCVEVDDVKYEFNYELNKKYVHEKEVDYEELSKTFLISNIAKFNGAYYSKKTNSCLGSDDGVKHLDVSSKVFIDKYEIFNIYNLNLNFSHTKNEVETIHMDDSSLISKLGDSCFKNYKTLKEVYLGPKISAISKNCFENCTNLTYVQIPNGLSIIENKAFSNCTNLKVLYLPRSIKTIKEDAFINCNLSIISESPLDNTRIADRLKLLYKDDVHYFYKYKGGQ